MAQDGERKDGAGAGIELTGGEAIEPNNYKN
jgi:hypothetical protein